MSQTVSISVGKPYGLTRVLSQWEISRWTYYWQRSRHRAPVGAAAGKRGPVGPCEDEALVGEIKIALQASPFHGEGHRKVWAMLRSKGIRSSKARILRLMRRAGLLAPTRLGNAHGPKAHDGRIRTDRPDEMWGTDMTQTLTLAEGKASVFVSVDHCTMECIGIHASAKGDRFQALEPINQGVREQFGAIGSKTAAGLKVRHDHGSAYLSDDFQDQLEFLGIESSPSFVREPQGNGCAEWFIRILKENLLWVRTFETIEQLRQALLEFKARYNSSWLIARHGYKSPAAIRRELLGRQQAVA